MINDVIGIAKEFNVIGIPVSFEECTAGHINNTYIVTFDNQGVLDKYVLQKIFSSKNSSNGTHKIITILGIKIKTKKL